MDSTPIINLLVFIFVCSQPVSPCSLHFYQLFATSIPLESVQQPATVAFPLFTYYLISYFFVFCLFRMNVMYCIVINFFVNVLVA